MKSEDFRCCRTWGLKPSPLLGKGGVAAPSKRCCEATKSGADGVVRSREIVLEFERTTPSAPFNGTGIFLDVASTPPLPRGGACFWAIFLRRFAASLRSAILLWLLICVLIPPSYAADTW